MTNYIYVEGTWDVTNDGRVEVKTLTFTEEERKHYEWADKELARIENEEKEAR